MAILGPNRPLGSLGQTSAVVFNGTLWAGLLGNPVLDLATRPVSSICLVGLVVLMTQV